MEAVGRAQGTVRAGMVSVFGLWRGERVQGDRGDSWRAARTRAWPGPHGGSQRKWVGLGCFRDS